MPDARLIYADTESSADQRYATSVFIPDPFVWAQVKRGSTLKNYMILSPLEVARIKAERPDFEIFSFGEAEKLFHLKDLSPAWPSP